VAVGMAAGKGRPRTGKSAGKEARARRGAGGAARAGAAKAAGKARAGAAGRGAAKAAARKPAKRPRAQSTKRRATPRRRTARKPRPQPRSDFVIVEDNLGFDPQKENAERRAYLEEARSQDVSD